MDSTMHSTSATSSRKRSRENETESQRLKREKAAERQRRKRERDRNNNATGIAMMGFTSQNDHHQHIQQTQQQQQQQQHPHPPSIAVPVQQQPVIDYRDPTEYAAQPDLTPEEVARRDRVRAAARERQRKHRMLVKQRKMRELGVDMGNEIMQGMEDVHYRVNADGQYQQVLPHELHQQPQPPPPMGGPHEPPFPQGQPLGGQTFASTLLLSFSCAPLLKQHLLRTLHMTNEELASLEPILAEAWERWDHARRAHYAEQAAKAGLAPPNLGPTYAVELTHEQAQQQSQPPPHPTAYALPSNGPTDSPHPPNPTNEFRARFHRPLVAPTPFRTYTTDAAPASTSSSTSVTVPDANVGTGAAAIDPHLAGVGAGQQTNGTGNSNGQVNGTDGAGKSESPGSGDASFVGDDPDFG